MATEQRTGVILKVVRRERERTHVDTCQSYREVSRPDGVTLVELFDSVDRDGREPIGVIALDPGDFCYVLEPNFGSTVDRLPHAPREAKLKQAR